MFFINFIEIVFYVIEKKFQYGLYITWIFAIYGMIRFVFGIGKGITSFVKGMF